MINFFIIFQFIDDKDRETRAYIDIYLSKIHSFDYTKRGLSPYFTHIGLRTNKLSVVVGSYQ